MGPRVQAVVDTIVEERDRFERFCRSLSEDELTRPVPISTWIVKDFISHLATLDEPIGRWFAAVADGDGSAGMGGGADSEPWNVDRFNDTAVAARRERPLDEIIAGAVRQRAALLGVLGRLEDTMLDQTIRFGGDGKRPPRDIPFGQFLQGWARHDVIHVADMLKTLPERRGDPEVVAWFARPEVHTVVDFYQKAMA
jgi:hypothetical protein